MKLIVEKEHQSNYPNPICFQKGDYLLIGQKKSVFEGWLWITTPDRNQGWAPEHYIKVEDGNRAVASQDYAAMELDTCIGDELHLHFELNGWGWVEKEDGSCGWIPMETTQAI